MYTFLLDNSALNAILKDDFKTDSLIRNLKGSTYRVVVGFDTLTENFGGQTEFVIKRVPNLKKIIDSIPLAQFILAKSGPAWLDAEKKYNGRFKNIPALYNTQRWPGFIDYLRDTTKFEPFHRSLEDSRKEIDENAQILIERDRAFREKGRELLPPNEVLQLLENFSLDAKTFKATQLALALKLSVRKAKKILSGPEENYKIHKAWLAAFYLRSIGNAFNQFDRYPKYAFLSKIKKGNWSDLGIIAQSSQFDYLVSNDKDQRAICNFLSEKGVFQAKAIDLDEFNKILARPF